MSYADALADLRRAFGAKKSLTMQDIAPHLGKSPEALAKLLQRGRFPLKVSRVGSSICVSIYDLARFLGGAAEEQQPPNATDPGKASIPPAAERPSGTKGKATPSMGKPARSPPSLGRLVRGYAKRLEELTVELEAERMLFAELEAMEIDRLASRGRTEVRKKS